MSNIKKLDLIQLKSKKLPPPPLCLPAGNSTIDEDQILNEQKNNSCCSSSSSSKECPHENIPYVLPIGQRSQILDKLIASSSTLLVPPVFDTKQRKSQNTVNLLKQHQASKQGTVTDNEWIDFIRLIVQKPLENDLTMLLDKYKMIYFDRVNSPNTTDQTIRTALCDIASQTLSSYSTCSSLPTTSSMIEVNDTSSSNTSNNSKRKRKTINPIIPESSKITINNQTKFVLSYIIPGKCDININSNKIIYQQRYKQFQKKYSRLFKYIPDKDEQIFLGNEGHLKINSSRSSNNQNDNICLMLYDEVVPHMDEFDLELSEISVDDSFTLPDFILQHILSSTT